MEKPFIQLQVVGGGGGGAGGFREYKNSCDPYTASPLNGNPCGTAITVSVQGYPIEVGGGATPVASPPIANGGPSTFFNNNISRWWNWRYNKP